MELDKVKVSIIFPAKNEGSNVLNTLDSLYSAKTNISFEVIVVDDASTDGCCDFLASYNKENEIKLIRTEGVGSANARNIGAEISKGDILIFCDAHLFFEDFWIDHLLEPISSGIADATTPGIAPTDKPNVVGYGQSLNESNLKIKWYGKQENAFPVAILPGGCFAVKRDVFLEIGGFEKGFKVWGYEDVEFSIKMWLFGYTCYAQPNIKVLHLFRKVHPYTVPKSFEDYNMMRMAYSHFNEERIAKCKKLIFNQESSDSLINSLLKTDILQQREHYFSKRKYNDDWFFEKFGIKF